MKNLIAALCIAFTLSCTGMSGMVATATFDGSGGFWTDGVVLVALGEYEGNFSMYGKSTGIEVIFPLDVKAGEVFLYNRTTGEETMQNIDLPLPAWASTVFRPGEAAALGLEFLPGPEEQAAS